MDVVHLGPIDAGSCVIADMQGVSYAQTPRVAVDLGEYGAAGARGRRARRPPVRRPHLTVVQVVAALLAALLAAELAVVAVHLSRRDPGPAAAARALLHALATGDGTAAAALLDLPGSSGPGESKPGQSAAGQSAAARSAAWTGGTGTGGASRLTAADARQDDVADLAVGAVTRHGATATVELTSMSGDVVLDLARRPGDLLHGPRWVVVGGLPVLHLTAPAYEQTALVDGRPLPLVHGAATVTVFPGLVPVGLPLQRPAGAVGFSVGAGSGTADLEPPVDADTQDALSQAVSFHVIPGGQVPNEGPNSVHPSHVDVDEVDLGADGRTLTFHAYLDQLVRAQLAYDAVTAQMTGTAVYDESDDEDRGVVVTSLHVTSTKGVDAAK